MCTTYLECVALRHIIATKKSVHISTILGYFGIGFYLLSYFFWFLNYKQIKICNALFTHEYPHACPWMWGNTTSTRTHWMMLAWQLQQWMLVGPTYYGRPYKIPIQWYCFLTGDKENIYPQILVKPGYAHNLEDFGSPGPVSFH